MANFAVAAPDDVINQGKELLEKLAQPGEKQSDTLRRIFQMVSADLDGETMKAGGVDVQALDASIATIRASFVAAVGGREQILAEKDAKIADLRAQIETIEKESREIVKKAEDAKIEAEKATDEARKTADAAVKQADTANNLVSEKENVIAMLTEKLAEAENKAKGYGELKSSEEALRNQVSDLQHRMETEAAATERKMSEAKKDAEIHEIKALDELRMEMGARIQKLQEEKAAEHDANKEKEAALKAQISELQHQKETDAAVTERRLSEVKKDAALHEKEALDALRKEMEGQVQQLREEKAGLQTRVEILQEQIQTK